MAIEELRRAIEQRLTEAGEEIERLEAALSALGHSPGEHAAGDGDQPARKPDAQPRRRFRAPRLTIRQAVLEALAAGEAMTASQVAAVTGLRSRAVAPELSKLLKTGELIKAERGYTTPSSGALSTTAPTGGTDGGTGQRAEKSAAVRRLGRELDAGMRTRP